MLTIDSSIQEQKEKRSKWIDIAKFMAIIAVLIDHTNGILYSNPQIAYFSYYSVSLFILVMGITSYWSMNKENRNVVVQIKKKCWGILRPYLVATFIYCIVQDKFFDLNLYLKHLIHFNASGPLYYVLLYIQLVIITPVIYTIFKFSEKKRNGVLVEIIGLIIVLFLSSITTNYSDLLSVYGGGGKLLGGSYLILFYLGMWIGKYQIKIRLKKYEAILVFILSLTITILWWKFIAIDRLQIDSYVPYGRGFNPPSISFGTYGILWALTICILGKVLVCFNISSKIIDLISYLGKHTLYIFLYHRLFLDFVLPHLALNNLWVKRCVYFGVMLIGSIVIEFILKEAYRGVLKMYCIESK